MSYKSSTSASATFNFQADLEVRCLDDNFDFEVEQSALRIDRNGTDVYASFEALIVMLDQSNSNNRAIIHFDLSQLALSNLEKRHRCSAASHSVRIEKITSEDEEVRRRFYDAIEDWVTEFELHVYAAD